MSSGACPKYDCSYIFESYQVFNWSNKLQYTNISRAPVLEANPDVSGIGVISAFLVTTIITYTFVLAHYLLAPGYRNCNELDHRTLGGLRKRYPRAVLPEKWSNTLKSLVLSFSDQQIVTGVAILVSGISQLKCGLSAYHWQIIVHLAWFSSVTHLSTLTLLQDYFRANRAMRYVRATLMVTLAGILAWALIPTGLSLWLYKDKLENVDNESYFQSLEQGGRRNTMNWGNYSGIPAQCYLDALWDLRWKSLFYIKLDTSPDPTTRWRDGNPNLRIFPSSQFVNMVLSLVILLLNLFSRVAKISPTISKFLSKWIGGKFGGGMTAFLKRHNESLYRSHTSKMVKKGSSRYIIGLYTRIAHVLLLRLYIIVYALFETSQSYLFELLYLLFAISWGGVRIFTTRNSVTIEPDPAIEAEENFWGFGQVLCCSLILLSVLASFESFYDASHQVEENAGNPGTTSPTTPHEGSTPILAPQTEDQGGAEGDIGLEMIDRLPRSSTGISIGTEERTIGLQRRAGGINEGDPTARQQTNTPPAPLLPDAAAARPPRAAAAAGTGSQRADVLYEHMLYIEDFHRFPGLLKVEYLVISFFSIVAVDLFLSTSLGLKSPVPYITSTGNTIFQLLVVLFAYVEHSLLVYDIGHSGLFLIWTKLCRCLGLGEAADVAERSTAKTNSRFAFAFYFFSFVLSFFVPGYSFEAALYVAILDLGINMAVRIIVTKDIG